MSLAQAQSTAEKPNAELIEHQINQFLERFRTDYGIVLSEAQISANHTDTDGWRKLYAEHRQKVKDARIAYAKRLKFFSDLMETRGLDEDDEKSLKEIAKGSAGLRVVEEQFQTEVVDRVLAPVHDCEKTINRYKTEAERLERDAPLHMKGVADRFKAELATHDKAGWDPESGAIKFTR